MDDFPRFGRSMILEMFPQEAQVPHIVQLSGDAAATKNPLAIPTDLRLLQSMSTANESNNSIKKAAARLVRQLPDSASWDDLMYEILVRQKIEAGLKDLREGRKHAHASIREEFGTA